VDDEPQHRYGRLRESARDDVSLADRMLVEWVAQASVGDAFPDPFGWARNPLQSVILTLADLGVMQRPAPGTPWDAIAAEASTAARAWLAEHPAGGGAD
jgi:hypothetical protein